MTADTKPRLMKLDLAAPHVIYKLHSGQVVEGVTTILGNTLVAHELYWWFWDQGRQGTPWPIPRETIGMDLGSIIHARAEAFLKGYDGLDPEGLPEADFAASVAPYERFRERWEASGYKVLHSELQLVSEQLRYGGTLDIVAESKDGIVLVDLKSTKPYRKGEPYLKHRVQVGAYARLWHENLPVIRPIQRAEIWRLGKTASDKGAVHVIDDLGAHERAFAALCAAHHALKACG